METADILKTQQSSHVEITNEDRAHPFQSYSTTTGVPKMFPTVATSLGYVHTYSRGALRR
jgi:hypothetical protein